MTIIRNILAFIVGAVVGGAVNMAIITIGMALIPPPGGASTDAAEIAKAIGQYQPQHFITPFLAHALGTLVGALVAYAIAASYRSAFAYAIGVLTLIGGIAACFMIPAPAWFMALDLIVAYIPMAWLAVLIGRSIIGPNPRTAMA
jgi:hypothetical protein